MRQLRGVTSLVAVGMLAFLGCGSKGLETFPVRGEVIFDGAPLTQGMVNYVPAQSGVGRVASGAIQPDGTFILTTQTRHDGAMKGEYNIVIYAYDGSSDAPTREETEGKGAAGGSKLRSLIPEKYLDPSTSGLSDAVDENHSGFKKIELGG